MLIFNLRTAEFGTRKWKKSAFHLLTLCVYTLFKKKCKKKSLTLITTSFWVNISSLLYHLQNNKKNWILSGLLVTARDGSFQNVANLKFSYWIHHTCYYMHSFYSRQYYSVFHHHKKKKPSHYLEWLSSQPCLRWFARICIKHADNCGHHCQTALDIWR